MAGAIKAGMKLTCENGHHIATVGVDMGSGDKIRIDHFTDWQIPTPGSGTDVQPCPVCGANYITPRLAEARFTKHLMKGHFEGYGWLP